MSVLTRTIVGIALLALACAHSGTPAALAQGSQEGAANTQAPLAACRADVARLCPDAKGGKRGECLEKNTDKLSPSCAAAFADVTAKAKTMRDACADDVKTHCATASKGNGGRGIVQCLRSNTAKLSSACNAAISARFGAQ